MQNAHPDNELPTCLFSSWRHRAIFPSRSPSLPPLGVVEHNNLDMPRAELQAPFPHRGKNNYPDQNQNTPLQEVALNQDMKYYFSSNIRETRNLHSNAIHCPHFMQEGYTTLKIMLGKGKKKEHSYMFSLRPINQPAKAFLYLKCRLLSINGKNNNQRFIT